MKEKAEMELNPWSHTLGSQLTSHGPFGSTISKEGYKFAVLFLARIGFGVHL